jgi:hypothetical protein
MPAPSLLASHPDLRKLLRLLTRRLQRSPMGLHIFVIFVTFVAFSLVPLALPAPVWVS